MDLSVHYANFLKNCGTFIHPLNIWERLCQLRDLTGVFKQCVVISRLDQF